MARHHRYRSYLSKREKAKTQTSDMPTLAAFAAKVFRLVGGISAILSLEILTNKYLPNNPIAIIFSIILAFAMTLAAYPLIMEMHDYFHVKHPKTYFAIFVVVYFLVIVTISTLARNLFVSLCAFIEHTLMHTMQ